MSGFDLSKTAGAGIDSMEVSESMPMLKILQDMSAEVKTSHKDHEIKKIDGAKAGDIVFMKEHCVVPTPFQVIPVAQDTVYVEWRPKEVGGGIEAQHGAEILTHPNYRKGEGKDKYKEYIGDNELKKTTYVLVKLRINGGWETAIIGFSGGYLKKIRAWNTLIKNFRYTDKNLANIAPPMFARQYDISTEVDENQAGETYYNWKIVPTENGTLDPAKDEEVLNLCNDLFNNSAGALPSPEVKQLTAGDEPF